MACNRGKASPNANTRIKLFAHSGGYCQNPNCNIPLFPEQAEKDSHFAEMAHIFAATDGGPRTFEELSEEERGEYANLILLCANCHTIIDKESEVYSDNIITKWKHEHTSKLQLLFEVRELSTREELRKAIEPLLMQNHTVWKSFGPDLEYQFNPEAPEASAWKYRVKSTIIPNSNKILMFLDVNSNLIDEGEKGTREAFRLHVTGLISHHIDGDNSINTRFPEDMDNIAKDLPQ